MADNEVLVSILQNEDGEACWIEKASTEGGADWIAFLPAEDLAAFEAAHATIERLIGKAVDHSGRDEHGMAITPCGEWDGGNYRMPPPFWNVVYGATETERGRIITAVHNSEQEAVETMEHLKSKAPALLVVAGPSMHAGLIEDMNVDELSVKKVEPREYSVECQNCGHPKNGH